MDLWPVVGCDFFVELFDLWIFYFLFFPFLCLISVCGCVIGGGWLWSLVIMCGSDGIYVRKN